MAAPVPHRLSLLGALVGLVVLTGLSWGLAHAQLGGAGTAVALGIAALKASVVALVFMEIAHASTVVRVVALVTVLFIVLLCLGVAGDTGLRGTTAG
jgi:cytochrome c oxidase subunit 4